MIKKIVSWIHLLLIAALLPACGPVNKPVVDRGPLKVEYSTWPGDYTLLVAQEKGFFAKHHVQVEPVYYEVFSNAIPELAAAKFDVGLFSIGDVISISRSVNVKVPAVYDSGGTSAIAAQANIASIADLKGKRIGVNLGYYTELFVDEMLKKAGLTLHDVTLVNVDPEFVPEKLSSNEIDAGYVWEPYDQMAIDAGHQVIFASSETSQLFHDVIVFREAVTQERPEDVRAFLAAWFEAVDYRMANPQDSNQIIAKITGQKIEDVEASSKIHIYNQKDNLDLFKKDAPLEQTIYYPAKANLDFLISNGGITLAPDLDKIFDPSFLQ